MCFCNMFYFNFFQSGLFLWKNPFFQLIRLVIKSFINCVSKQVFFYFFKKLGGSCVEGRLSLSQSVQQSVQLYPFYTNYLKEWYECMEATWKLCGMISKDQNINILINSSVGFVFYQMQFSYLILLNRALFFQKIFVAIVASVQQTRNACIQFRSMVLRGTVQCYSQKRKNDLIYCRLRYGIVPLQAFRQFRQLTFRDSPFEISLAFIGCISLTSIKSCRQNMYITVQYIIQSIAFDFVSIGVSVKIFVGISIVCRYVIFIQNRYYAQFLATGQFLFINLLSSKYYIVIVIFLCMFFKKVEDNSAHTIDMFERETRLMYEMQYFLELYVLW
eukprot:TRINITY_DN24791_c1_g1_i1.p2 TRINITY_DN24791_c1_g1~~TRINITY_DN24791_c1_g1_i1.p2  ORF type:complete len:331 (-),score=-11.10 TRINITY_DN24791_c1_g1_i1:1548-2540(-)